MRTFTLTLLFLPCLVHAQRERDELFSRKVSQMSLRKNVIELVQFGNRLAGTPSGDKAVKWLRDQFRSYGLPVSVVEEPATLTHFNDSWTLKVVRPKRLRGLIQNDWLGGFSPSLKLTTRRLVLLPSESGSDAKSVDSAFVLVDGDRIANVYSDLCKSGAAGVIAYNRVASSAYMNWAMINSLEPSKSNPIPLFNISRFAAEQLMTRLTKGDTILVSARVRSKIVEGKPKTVIATLKGESDDYYLVCAHGDADSGGPGADDNASGESGVLELARVFSLLRKAGKLPAPKYSIKFVVWGGEYRSSEQFVKSEADSLRKIRGVLNYDEIGTGKSRNCLYAEGNDKSVNEKLLRLFNDVFEEYVGKPGFWSEATTNPSQGGTDSYVFLSDYLRRLGVQRVEIPSITLFTAAWNEPHTLEQTRGWRSKAWKGRPDSVTIDYSLYYHSSLDIPKLTTEREPFDMAWAVKAVGIALLRLAW